MPLLENLLSSPPPKLLNSQDLSLLSFMQMDLQRPGKGMDSRWASVKLLVLPLGRNVAATGQGSYPGPASLGMQEGMAPWRIAPSASATSRLTGASKTPPGLLGRSLRAPQGGPKVTEADTKNSPTSFVDFTLKSSWQRGKD